MTIALCMIVRDEAEVIERCLRSVKPLIDAWVICDTGSDDRTPALVQQALEGVPGHLHHAPWRDFGSNRSELMEWAQGSADYLLLLDADMTLRQHAPLPELTHDAYLLLHEGPLAYSVPRLVRGDRFWWFEGLTHEYLATEGAYSQASLPALTVEHHGDGGHRSEKLERDLNLLEGALVAAPDDPRTLFYLAQTHRDLGNRERAFALYLRRGDLGGWDEEAAYALYQAGSLRAGPDPWAAIPILLSAWQRRPSRAEPLHELARICRFQGWHEAARVFGRRGLEIPLPADGLFVHRWIYEWGLRYELALAAHGTGLDLEAASEAARVLDCEGVSEDVREFLRGWLPATARQPVALDELLEDVELAQIQLQVLPDWPQFNPTIAADGNGYRMIVRTANYRVQDGQYIFLDGADTVRTINYLVELDAALSVLDVRPLVDASSGLVQVAASVEGYEDCRLVTVNGEWFATATVRDRNAQQLCEVALLQLREDEIASVAVLPGPWSERHEKNWMPFVDGEDLFLVYSCGPTVVLRVDPGGAQLTPVARHDAPAAAAALRGGSQGLAVEGGQLFVVHEAFDVERGRRYQHRFVLFDEDYRLAAMSPTFCFVSEDIEFCAGLARRGRQLLLTFGVGDHSAMLAAVDEQQVLALLAPAE